MPELQLYKCVINPDLDSDLQVEFTALVDNPAIQKNFQYFKDQAKPELFIDSDRHIISGPAMLAGVPIYRNDNGNEYYVVFEAVDIEMIVQKLFKKGLIQAFNIMHDPNMQVDGVTIFESYLIDRSRGINPPKGYEDALCGSWFISCKVDNPKVWDLIKDGTLKGFSVEGLFKQIPMQKVKFSLEEAFDKIIQLLNDTDL